MNISVIIPLYNRPQETDELLDSLTRQSFKEFEVVVVEDGSTIPAGDIVARYAQRLNLKYLVKENGGPASARNFGAKYATGDFYIFLDSDCILPPGYMLVAVANRWRCWGGADMATESFSPLQKAVNYSMTSFFTTGGIRGNRKGGMDKFFPRSFNMGVTQELFDKVGGFSDMRYGEDIDFSYKVVESGCTPHLLEGAEVYHKRRTSMRGFFRQVHASGAARIRLNELHPATTKLVHLLPALFTIFSVVMIFHAALVSLWSLAILSIPALVWFTDSAIKNGPKIGALSILTSYIQIYGYGTGYIQAFIMQHMRRSDD